MSWDKLGQSELRQLARWTDWAEHHAMREYERATEVTAKNCWKIELKFLAQTEVQLRSLITPWNPTP